MCALRVAFNLRNGDSSGSAHASLSALGRCIFFLHHCMICEHLASSELAEIIGISAAGGHISRFFAGTLFAAKPSYRNPD
jgi:hypothetical protein